MPFELSTMSFKSSLSPSFIPLSLSLSSLLPPLLSQIFEDAHDSPLEQRISDSIVATKDNKENGIFSLVPSRVATFPSPSLPSSTSQTDAVCNPDSFSDLFRLLGEWGGREGGREWGGREGGSGEGGREGVGEWGM